MLTEAELQKQWESLTFTDDFIFSRVMHSKNLTQNTTTKSTRRAAPQLPSPTGGLGGRQPPSGAGERGGFRRGKPPLPSRGVVPS